MSHQNKHCWSAHIVLTRMYTVLCTTGAVQIPVGFKFHQFFSCHSLTSSSEILVTQCNVNSQYMRQFVCWNMTVVKFGLVTSNTRQYINCKHQAHVPGNTTRDCKKYVGRNSAQLLFIIVLWVEYTWAVYRMKSILSLSYSKLKKTNGKVTIFPLWSLH